MQDNNRCCGGCGGCGCFGGNNCIWIFIILILFCCCGGNGFGNSCC